MTIRGRNGRLMSEKWATDGPGSLHGLTTHGFPNLFLTGPSQTGLSGNVTHVYDVVGRHAAYIVAEASKRSSDPGQTVIEPSKEHEEAWVNQLLELSTFMAPMAICLPNYRNGEGAALSAEDQIKAAKAVNYPLGMNAYKKLLEGYRESGRLEGLNVSG